MAQPPQNFHYKISTHELSWSSSGPDCEYDITYQKVGELNWHSLYIGTNINCGFNVPFGDYKVKGKARNPGSPDWGPEGTPEDINIA